MSNNKREQHKDVIIIGAGVTGLTSAFYLNKEQKDFLVLEEQERVGGVIRTVRENGFVYESGPNTGVIGQPEAALLFEDLGKDAGLEIAMDEVKKRYILKNGKWEALPSGLSDALKTPLFSFRDKIRILGEPFRRKGRHPEETLASLVMRRMGRSYLDYAVDPFILGVYAGNPETLVPKYALPKLYNLEQEYGSFIGGAFKKKFKKKTELEEKTDRSIFSVKGGLQNLTETLYEKTGADKFRTGLSDIEIKRSEKEFLVSYTDKNGVRVGYEANTVIVTTGSHKLSALLPFIKQEQLKKLTNLRYAKVIEVAVGFNKWNGMKPDAFGGLIPYKENRDILGVLFISSFLSDRAPADGALFTIFVGGVRRPELFQKTEEEIFEIVKSEFTDLMGISEFEPDLFRIFKHEWAIPQYEISSGERFAVIKELENEYPGLLLRGNFQGGIGLADRIKQGRLAADAV